MRPRDYARLVAAAARVEARRRTGRATCPYKLEFIVTFACGSRCRTCSIWKRYLDEPERRAAELCAEDIIRAAASNREHLRWISLTGGEVTDRPDLVELVEGLVAAVGDRLALFQLTTNGIAPDRVRAMFPRILRATRGIPTYVTISLDGLGRDYERVRGVPNGYERVQRSMQALREVAEVEPHLTTGWQVTLSELNASAADALFEAASEGQERPIITMATNALTLTSGRADVDVRRAGPEVVAALRRMWRRYPARSLRDLPPRLHLGLTQRFFATGEAPLPCVAGHSTLTIDPYGGVLQCDSRDAPLARLQDHDLDIPAMCRSDAFRQGLARWSGCRECWTPCQAYPTILHHPVGAVREYLRAVVRL